MVFNSNEFLVFAGIFFVLYFLVRGSLITRNWLIVLGSCVFYAAWDYRFLGLLLLSSLTDFFAGIVIGKSSHVGRRKWVLTLSLGVNLIILGAFKYFDFFQESLEILLGSLGWDVRWRGLSVVLPMGISFYTFQSMSYSIDVYRGVIRPTSDVVKFLGYVMFFPQLVAGPIERAQDLLPQFGRTLTIDAAKLEEGLWLILWGLFKKVALADNLALLVEMVYAGSEPTGPMVMMATAAFGLQIYCDFSGYSDIARGLGKLLGFELTANFYLPYFATSLREFWRRWHISLSTWLRDYLYLSLGGNRVSAARTGLNLMITMLIAGLWHGAAANFVLWGGWHGLGLVANRVWQTRSCGRTVLPSGLGWVLTMVFVFYGWILFRAESLQQALEFTRALAIMDWPDWGLRYVSNLCLLAAPLMVIQLWQARSGNLLAPLAAQRGIKILLQGCLLLGIAGCWNREAPPFIYFQF